MYPITPLVKLQYDLDMVMQSMAAFALDPHIVFVASSIHSLLNRLGLHMICTK